MDDLQFVAYREFVLHVDLGHAVRARNDVTDILLAETFGVAAHIVLLLMGVVAFVETIGVAAVRQCV